MDQTGPKQIKADKRGPKWIRVTKVELKRPRQIQMDSNPSGPELIKVDQRGQTWT